MPGWSGETVRSRTSRSVPGHGWCRIRSAVVRLGGRTTSSGRRAVCSEVPETGGMPPAAVQVADAVVIGAGPNGLVAANALVDAGWDVVVLEAQPTVGGAVRSAQVTAPGFISDLFSAFYPL